MGRRLCRHRSAETEAGGLGWAIEIHVVFAEMRRGKDVVGGGKLKQLSLRVAETRLTAVLPLRGYVGAVDKCLVGGAVGYTVW